MEQQQFYIFGLFHSLLHASHDAIPLFNQRVLKSVARTQKLKAILQINLACGLLIHFSLLYLWLADSQYDVLRSKVGRNQNKLSFFSADHEDQYNNIYQSTMKNHLFARLSPMQNAAQKMRQEAALNKPQPFNDIWDKMRQIAD